MIDFIIDKLKEIKQIQNLIKLDELDYVTKKGKRNDFREFSLAIAFLRDIHEVILSIEGIDKGQSKPFCKIR